MAAPTGVSKWVVPGGAGVRASVMSSSNGARARSSRRTPWQWWSTSGASNAARSASGRSTGSMRATLGAPPLPRPPFAQPTPTGSRVREGRPHPHGAGRPPVGGRPVRWSGAGQAQDVGDDLGAGAGFGGEDGLGVELDAEAAVGLVLDGHDVAVGGEGGGREADHAVLLGVQGVVAGRGEALGQPVQQRAVALAGDLAALAVL